MHALEGEAVETYRYLHGLQRWSIGAGNYSAAIGAVLPGLTLAAGFSGHGFGIGPGAGHLIADLVSGATPVVDASGYDPARLAGSAWGKVAEF